jgi:glycosyltransferase involved in cell wall biosynthesis
MVAAMADRRRRVCLLSSSVIEDDVRVRRHGDALWDAGWQVTALGFGGSRSAPVAWQIIEAAKPPEPVTWRRALRALCLAAGGHIPAAAAALHCHGLLRNFFVAAEQHAPPADLYIANDWPMLPLAAALARRSTSRYLYDSHELATAEYAESRKWRLVNLPYVRAIESRYIAGAAAILTVSEGIAESLVRLYGLAALPAVVRNVPAFREVSTHVLDRRRIGLLYHGLVAPGRGLEELIASVAQWRPEFGLTIRGPIQPVYGDELRRLTAALGVEHRIEFAPAVTPNQLIDLAAKSDIGIVAMPGNSLNSMLALPNKFFEYVMAGLALCVTDLPEMARLVRRFDLGRLTAASESGAIAAAVNGFTPEEIDHCRSRARLAARELNWQRESQRLVDACERAVAPRA